MQSDPTHGAESPLARGGQSRTNFANKTVERLGEEEATAIAQEALRKAKLETQNKDLLYQALQIYDSWHDVYSKKCIGFVNLMYFLILVGCELDLYGFAMAFKSYWDMDISLVRILLIIQPCGYLIAVAMYIGYTDEIQVGPETPPASGRSQGFVSTFKSWAKGRVKPVQLWYYHFPIVRYYLVIKDKERDDIEGLFRVNSLSSFTLGIAQLVSMGMLVAVRQEEMSMFVKINVISQAVNWLITLMYFMTSISSQMAGQIEVRKLTQKIEDDLREKYEDYLHLQSQCAADPAKQRAMDAFIMTVDNEILYMSNKIGDVDFEKFLGAINVKYKLDALRRLRFQRTLEYAKIGR